MIVKPSDEEAKLLDRCLSYVAPYVDEICLTITGENTKCVEVGQKYGAKLSSIPWEHDFAKARNFNFAQATGDYILWLDCDDVLRGAENLKALIERMVEEHIDTIIMYYLYDFDKYKVCTVKHLKTRIVKNDGCVKWVGKLHEDFEEQRALNAYAVHDLEVLHLTSDKRAVENFKRNTEIAENILNENPLDPRSVYLVANAYLAEGRKDEAKDKYVEFLKVSGSDEEKYIALLNLYDITQNEIHPLKAICLRPTYPNAYFKLAEWNYNHKRLEVAQQFIEIGLQLPIPDTKIIVYNPRDYDFNPLMLLVKILTAQSKWSKALETIKTIMTIYPKDENLKNLRKYIKEEMGDMDKADEYIKKAQKKKDPVKYIESLPEQLRSHPKICYYYNSLTFKKESSGKDVVFFCSHTAKDWNPLSEITGGVGGSEEAVINLSRELARLGWNVTVYNNCGKECEDNGVKYRFYWKYNIKDKQDVTIFWRHPRPAEYKPNSKVVCIDMHDVIGDAEFNKERMDLIDMVFVKSNCHRELFPSIPDNKVSVISNGVNLKFLDGEEKRDPFLILNTSSPDRHLEATLRIFRKLHNRDPRFRLAWYYGWGTYDTVHQNNKEMMDFKKRMMKEFDDLKAQGIAEGGTMISHSEIGKLYQRAGIFLYPTQFMEINCISGLKAQASGCLPVVSNFGALKETVKWGKKIDSLWDKWGKESTFGENEDKDEEYIQAIIDSLQVDDHYKYDMQEDIKSDYNWKNIALKWHNKFNEIL